MSGTSLDGIDAALLFSDGKSIEPKPKSPPYFVHMPYDEAFKQRLRAVVAKVAKRKKRGKASKEILDLEKDLTNLHAAAVNYLLKIVDLKPSEVDVIGFHGHTILHRPESAWTWQIGDGQLLAKLTGIDVVNDFRSQDMVQGGQGAPLLPLYHQAMLGGRVMPSAHTLAILNIGGVANITYIVNAGVGSWMQAFDTGPGNALIDDWVNKKTGKAYDENGELAVKGSVDAGLINSWLQDEFFEKTGPKSLDRNYFKCAGVEKLSLEDGAANLTAFTVATIQLAVEILPTPPVQWYVTGGGRNNSTMVDLLRAVLKVPVEPIEQLGLNGDAVEAEGFAYLAVKHLAKMPTSLPEITGASGQVLGGVFCPK
jgi:anhydro-N-acetylmuramic acid kinase